MSLKGVIGRRIFAKALPVMPLAAATQTHGLLAGTSISNHKPFPLNPGPDTDSNYVERRKKLDAAREFLYNKGGMDALRRKQRLDSFTTLNPNITALRSVSDQHKIHMHLKHEANMSEERTSFETKILRMFGLDTDKTMRYELF